MTLILRLAPLLFTSFFIGTAVAQNISTPRIGVDADTGARIATTMNAADTKKKNGYSLSAQSEIVFWVEARQETNGDVHAMFKGEQLRYILPNEAGTPGRYGSRPSEYPAYVGSPLVKSTMTYPWLEVTCLDKSHWCTRVQAIQIDLDANQVRTMIGEKADATIAISISDRRRVEWRMPKADLSATLDALGVLAQFR